MPIVLFREKYSAAAFMLHSFKLPNPYILSSTLLFQRKKIKIFSVLAVSNFAVVWINGNTGKRELSLNTESCILSVIIVLIEKLN